MESRDSDLELTAEQRSVLRAALRRAGLLGAADKHWDSLDVACALAIAETELDLEIADSAVSPRELTSIDGLERALKLFGRPSARCVRLTVDLSRQYDSSRSASTQPQSGLTADSSSFARRRAEFRLALTYPAARVAISRSGPVRVAASATQLSDLPISGSLVGALMESSGVAKGAAIIGLGADGGYQSVADQNRGAMAGQAAEHVESSVRDFVVRLGGDIWAPSGALIAIDELTRLGYYQAHPEQVITIDAGTALTPAVCFGSYRTLPPAPTTAVMGTTVGTAFRRETRYAARDGRLPTFSCREILWHSSPADFAEIHDACQQLAASIADDLGLTWHWEDASDPFFLASGAGGFKRELIATVGDRAYAVASINSHGSHFTSRGYGREDWVTGCAAFGIERWVSAVTTR